MAWAVYALRGPGGVRRLEDMPVGYLPPSIGTAESVLDRVRQVAPDVEASDPSWLHLTGDEVDVEITFGKGVEVRDVTFYLNNGPRSIPAVLAISRGLGVLPYDTESGDLLTEHSRPPEPPPLTADEIADEVKAAKPRWWRFGRS